MGVKTAREAFTREEVEEILRRNVALYKNDAGFADYFAGLTMYLMEHQDGPKLVVPAKPPIPPAEATEPGFSARRSDGEVDLRAYLRRAPESLERERPRPPVPQQGAPAEAKPAASPSLQRIMKHPAPSSDPPQMPPPAAPIPPAVERPRQQSEQKAAASPFLTPVEKEVKLPKRDAKRAEGKRDELPPPLGQRTKIYKVARTYRSSSVIEMPCKECGCMLPDDAHRCARCGRVQ